MQLAEESRSIIFYESPYRLVKTLQQIADIFGGERRACVAREISKLHEDYQRGTLSELIEHFTEKGVKGEIVFIVAGKPKEGKEEPEDNEE
jgi:16S rRNA (cytidine1402-2'-O)-methyltransferase